jgi:hypothetical protein
MYSFFYSNKHSKVYKLQNSFNAFQLFPMIYYTKMKVKKYILYPTFEHLGVYRFISHSSSKFEDNQRFSCEDVYILDVPFHF